MNEQTLMVIIVGAIPTLTVFLLGCWFIRLALHNGYAQGYADGHEEGYADGFDDCRMEFNGRRIR